MRGLLQPSSRSSRARVLVIGGTLGVGRLTPRFRTIQVYPKCKIWYLISPTVSEDNAHRGNINDRSVRAFAVKPRAFGARAALVDRSTRPSKPGDRAANATLTATELTALSDNVR
jgi:hypothetical protein